MRGDNSREGGDEGGGTKGRKRGWRGAHRGVQRAELAQHGQWRELHAAGEVGKTCGGLQRESCATGMRRGCEAKCRGMAGDKHKGRCVSRPWCLRTSKGGVSHHCTTRSGRDMVHMEDLVVEAEKVGPLRGAARHQLRHKHAVLAGRGSRDYGGGRLCRFRTESEPKAGDDHAAIFV